MPPSSADPEARPGAPAPASVLSALAVVVALGALLGFRLVAGGRASSTDPNRPVAPAATVPAPKALSLATLAAPCWGCPDAAKWPIAFRTDLELLAPLGNGPVNAGLFFKDFAKPNGSRFAKADATVEAK